jgi:hypothetical protein
MRNYISKNKWVVENGKWVEYKCIKFNSGSKKYLDILTKASKLNDIDIHYLVNTLEDVLFDRKYIKDEQASKQKA